MEISESHQVCGAWVSLPPSEVGNQSSDKQWYRHQRYSHRTKSVNVFPLTVLNTNFDSFCLPSGSIEPTLHSNFPKAPKQSSEGNQGTWGSVEDHIGFPLITHVSCSDDLENREDIPSEEQCIPVCKVKAQTRLEIGLKQLELLYLSLIVWSVVACVICH